MFRRKQRPPPPPPNRPAKRAAPAKGAAPKPKPRPKTPSAAAPAPAPDAKPYTFEGRLVSIVYGTHGERERIGIEGPWREKGSEEINAFMRLFPEGDDLASSEDPPLDSCVWVGEMCVGPHTSYTSSARDIIKDRLVLRFRSAASEAGTFTLDGEGKAGANTYKLTGTAKASGGGFDVKLERTYCAAPKLPPAPRRRSRAPPPASLRSSRGANNNVPLAAFNTNGGALVAARGQVGAAFWAKPSGVDGLNVDDLIKRDADAYRDENKWGKSERARRCAEHVYEKRRDLFAGQFADPVSRIEIRLCERLDARSERTATDAPASTDAAPAPAAVTVASAPPAAAPSAGDAVAATIDRFLGQAAAFALDGVVQDLSSDMSGVAAALLARSVPLSQLALGHLTLSCLDLCMLPVKVSVAGRTHLFHAAPLFSIGTHRANDVIVEDSAVASLHCVVLVLSRQIIVFGDFGEAGTRLVGDAVATARSPLVARRRDGARLRLGRDDAAPLVVISPLPGTA